MPNADDTIDLMRFQAECLTYDLETRHRDAFVKLKQQHEVIAARCRLNMRRPKTEIIIVLYEASITQFMRAVVPSLMVDCKGDR